METLIRIRSGFEKSLGAAVPDFRRFSARVTRLAEIDLPCVNLYFHRDRLVSRGNFSEEREVHFEVEACFKADGDPEAELSTVRKRIEDSVESNDELRDLLINLQIYEVDFAHEMIGQSRIAALAMTFQVNYSRLFLHRPTMPDVHEVWANGDRLIG